MGVGRLLIKEKRTRKTGLGKRKLRLIDDDANQKTCKRLSITDLPDDCLSHVYKRLKLGTDISSFGLVFRHWLRIQNTNHESLWDLANFKCSLRKSPNIGQESFSIILCKLLIRFRHLKSLSLSRLPEVTEYVISHLQLFGIEVMFDISNYSHKKLCLIFSSLPHLTFVRLSGTLITDKGLEVLSKCCVSLGNVDFTDCQRITDSGISFLIQNCSKLHSTVVSDCSSITGIGFLGCPKTLTKVWALRVPKLTTEGIKAILSGGGIQTLGLLGNAIIVGAMRKCDGFMEMKLGREFG
ncbi:F-box/LRR-repeat protein 12-like [Papaver somniferum]|uniref:F-box/LRR-repeat protein 12-like n=1 Tax=Papaver somniferum TaxID=3469 RepID=UPI000E7054B4|nr:F-box/LRR-repeat protein 12-like [Papaver somniferum]